MYDTNRSAFLERDLVGLSMDGNWQVWVRYCGSELMPIHTVVKGATGFSNVECTECKLLSATEARVECGGLADIETGVVL